MDCSTAEGSDGCSGGAADEAFKYVIDNNGIDTEASYPCLAVQQQECAYNPSTVGTQLTGFTNIDPGNEQALQSAYIITRVVVLTSMISIINSWGTGWGVNGYIYVPRNQNNYCGVASDASYPTALVCLVGARRHIPKEEVEKEFKSFKGADQGLNSHRLRVNPFADLTNEEFNAQMKGYRPPARKLGAGMQTVFSEEVLGGAAPTQLPATVNWTAQGLVTPVKYQGQCGDCWTFCSTGAIEVKPGQLMKNTGQLVSLSEPNLNDCSQQYGSDGCNGGNPEESFQYVIDNNGIDSEASYPFLMADGNPCNYNPANVGAQMTGFVQIPSGNETALQLAVAAVGPIACGFDGSGDVFQFYSSGYYNNPQCSNVNLDHCMTLVGYGT
ncbi:unnamed protein product, partial [Oppiella nova]